MASPSSGDDYYASLGNEPAQTSGGAEKKKIIKIVAKKVASPTSPETASAKEKESIPEKPVEAEQASQAPVDDVVPEAPQYVSRTVKLPESGTLDLGTKFSAGPAVVFHTHNTLPKPLASGKMRSNAPLTK